MGLLDPSVRLWSDRTDEVDSSIASTSDTDVDVVTGAGLVERDLEDERVRELERVLGRVSFDFLLLSRAEPCLIA